MQGARGLGAACGSAWLTGSLADAAKRVSSRFADLSLEPALSIQCSSVLRRPPAMRLLLLSCLLASMVFVAHGEVAVSGGQQVAASFVKVLTDANFEHDTQASTGATTGDWFVEFYAPVRHEIGEGRGEGRGDAHGRTISLNLLPFVVRFADAIPLPAFSLSALRPLPPCLSPRRSSSQWCGQ